jgi:hypothetical protein
MALVSATRARDRDSDEGLAAVEHHFTVLRDQGLGLPVEALEYCARVG